MMRTTVACLASLLLLCTFGCSSTRYENQSPSVGTLEVIAKLPINPGNIAISQDGRLFTTVHQFRRAPVQLIEITGERDYRPWPDESWNGAFGSSQNVFNSLLGIVIDRSDRLWVIDNGVGDPPQQPKLLAFSVATGELLYRFDFPNEIGPRGSFLQDLAIDENHGYAFLADVGRISPPAIVALDLERSKARRFERHPGLRPEDINMVIDGSVVAFSTNDGASTPARVGVNPITISEDGETLYFGAMNGTKWYQVATELFRTGKSDREIAKAVKVVGPKPVSDGASTDREGNHFFTSVTGNAIDMLSANGDLNRIVEDPDLSWPDALSFGPDNWLYVAVNQLHRAPMFNHGKDTSRPPYLIARVWTGTQGIPGR